MAELSWKGLVLPAAALAVWSLAVENHLLSGPMAVSPVVLLQVPFIDPDGREIWAALGASLVRLALGGSLGAVAGIGLGLALGLSRTLGCALSPSVDTLRQIALFAWIPLLTAWFGNSETAKIVFIALGTFFPLVLATQQGVRATPAGLVELVRVLGLSPRRRITALYLPSALPAIAMGVQIALISAWIGTVGAEYAIGNGRGLGAYIASGREQFRMDITLVGVLALALIGVALHALGARLIRHLDKAT